MSRLSVHPALMTLVLLFSMVGCAKDPSNDAPDPSSEQSAKQPIGDNEARVLAACELLTRAEAEQLTGLTVIDVYSELSNECKYKVGDDSSLQIAWTSDAGDTGFEMARRGAEQGVERGLPPAVELQGLGDEALFQQHSDGMFQTLTARKGDGVLVIAVRGAFAQGRDMKGPLSNAASTALKRAEG